MRKHRPGPFALPVRDIVHRPGEMRESDFAVPTAERWGEGLVSVAAGEHARVTVRAESVHEGILVSGEANSRYTGVCGRCLTDIDRPVRIEFQELFAYSGDEASDYEVRDDHVDLETVVRDAIILALPFQPVCRPECPGLDPVTGQRRDEEDRTESSGSIDPRWEALQRFTTDHDDDRPGAPAHGIGTTEKS